MVTGRLVAAGALAARSARADFGSGQRWHGAVLTGTARSSGPACALVAARSAGRRNRGRAAPALPGTLTLFRGRVNRTRLPQADAGASSACRLV